MAHRSKAAGGKPGNKTKRSSSNILVLIDTEHASTVGNTSTYIQHTKNESGHPCCCNWWEQEGEIFKKRK